jgi:glycosyltransferase involved in cell wall biosynthesis
MSGLISVCIPTYNNPAAFKRCLGSVLTQSYSNIEIIITDDSTNEDSKRIVEIANDSRVRYIRNKPSLGSPANWNKAIGEATGDYIKIMHHDDWFASDTALASFVAATRNAEGSALIFCKGFNCGENKRKEFRPGNFFLKKIRKDPFIIFYANRIGDPSMIFFSRSRLKKFDVKSRWFVDSIFYYDFLTENGGEVVYIDKALINVTSSNPEQLTHKIPGKEKFAEALYTFRKYRDIASESRKFIFKITFIEMLIEFKVTSLDGFGLSQQERECLSPLLKWAKLGFPHLVFSAIRNILIRL